MAPSLLNRPSFCLSYQFIGCVCGTLAKCNQIKKQMKKQAYEVKEETGERGRGDGAMLERRAVLDARAVVLVSAVAILAVSSLLVTLRLCSTMRS